MRGDQTQFNSLPECHLSFPRVAQVQDELATTGDLERDACVGQDIRNLARHAGQPRETIGDVVGHRADKRDITFGVYTQGASEAQWRACVESVSLPAMRTADCSKLPSA